MSPEFLFFPIRPHHLIGLRVNLRSLIYKLFKKYISILNFLSSDGNRRFFVRKSLISAFSQKLYKKGKKNVFGSNFGEFSKISSVLAWCAAPLAEDSPFLGRGSREL